MTDQIKLASGYDRLEALAEQHQLPASWDEPIICRVEVDLPAWLNQLTGGIAWEICSESEDETYTSFALRETNISEKTAPSKAVPSQATPKIAPKIAEVTLYHNGYAVVDVEGQSLFDGTLTSGISKCAHLSYYHADSGEPISLN